MRRKPHKPSMRYVAIICLALCCPSQSAFAQVIEKVFAKTDIYRMSVEGFRLNMTQEEANKILKKNKWKGEWPHYEGPEAGRPFIRGGQIMYLLRYRSQDLQLRIWSIVNKAVFERPPGAIMPVNRALGRTWIDSIIAHYGEPSTDFINPNGINAYVYYLSTHYQEDAPKLEIYLGQGEATYELSDRSLLSQQAP